MNRAIVSDPFECVQIGEHFEILKLQKNQQTQQISKNEYFSRTLAKPQPLQTLTINFRNLRNQKL